MAIDIPLKVSLSIEEGKNQIDAIIKGSIEKLRREAAQGVDIDVGINIGIKGLNELKEFNQEASKASASNDKLAKANKRSQQQLTVSATLFRKLTKETLASRDATSYGSEAWNKYNQRLKVVQQLLNQQTGIQAGSIAILRQEAAALNESSLNLSLNEQQRRELNDAIRTNAREQRNVGGALKGSLNDLRAYAADLRRARDNEIAGTEAHRKYAQELKGIETAISSLQPKTSGLFQIFGKIAVVGAAIATVGSVFNQLNQSLNFVTNRQKQVESFRLSLQAFGFTQAESNRLFKQAADTANSLGAPLDQVESAYRRMIPVLDAVGISASDSDKFISNITARTQSLGLNTEQSGRLLEAFAQVLSKGKLQAEELNQQISELDGGFRTQLAAALGIATEELADFVKEGNVTAPIFVEAVNKMSNGVEILEERIRSGNFTLQQFQNLIRNINVKNLEEIGKILQPAIRAVAVLALEFSKLVETILQSQVGRFIGQVFAEAVAAIANFITIVIKAAGVVVQLVDPVFALLNVVNKLLGPIGGLGGVLAVLAARMILVKTATALASKELVIFGRNIAISSAVSKLGVALRKFGIGLKALSLGKQAVATRSFGSAVQGLIPNLGGATGALSKFGGGLGSIGKVFPLIINAVKLFGGAVIKFLSGPVGWAVTGITLLFGLLKPAGEAVAKFGKNFQDASDDLGEYGIKADDAVSKNKNLVVSFLRFGNPIGLTIELFKKLGEIAGKAIDAIADSWKNVQNFFKDKVIETQLSRIANLVDNARDKFAQYGDIVGKLGDISKLSADETKELDAVLKILANTTEENINALQEEIDTENKTKNPNKERIQRLTEQKKALEGQRAALEKNIKKVEDHAKAIRVETTEIKKQPAAIEALIAKYDDLIKKLKEASVKDQVRAIDEYNAGLINAETLTVKLAAQSLTLADQELKSLKAKIELRRQELEEFKGSVDEKKAKQKELDDQIEQSLEDEIELARQRQAFMEAVTAAIRAQVSELQGFSDKAREIANNFVSAAGDIASSASSAFNAFSSLADAQAEIALEQGGDPVAIAKEVLAIKKAGIEAERQFNAANIVAAAAMKKIELDIQKIRLETEARILESKGDAQSAARLRELLPAYDRLGKLIDVTTQNQLAANDAQATSARLGVEREAIEKGVVIQYDSGWQALQNTRKQQDKIIKNSRSAYDEALRIAEGYVDGSLEAENQASKVDEIRSNIYRAAEAGRTEMRSAYEEMTNAGTKATEEINKAAQEIDVATPVEQQVDKITQAYQDTAKDIGKSTEQIQEETENVLIEPRKDAKNLGEAFLQGLGDIKSVMDSFSQEYEQGLGRPFDRLERDLKRFPSIVNTAFQPIFDAADELQKIFGFNGPAPRWMGGPVAGGQTYRVNDGGGREAFLSASGGFSMLPAGRNINWTAPSTGTIIPAPYVNAFKRGFEIQNSVSVKSPDTKPRASAAAVSATLDSGNLLRQIKRSNEQGSSTQRITNNVTIQSQNPVMDASRIMIDMSKSRLRRKAF